MSILDGFRSLFRKRKSQQDVPPADGPTGSSAGEPEEPEYDVHYGRRSHRPIPPVRDPAHRDLAIKYAWFQTPERTAQWTLKGEYNTAMCIEWASYTYDDAEIEALHAAVLQPDVRAKAWDAALGILAARLPESAFAKGSELLELIEQRQVGYPVLQLAQRMPEGWLEEQSDALILVLDRYGTRGRDTLATLSATRREALAVRELDNGTEPWNLASTIPTEAVVKAALRWLADRDDPWFDEDGFLSLGEPLYDAAVDLDVQTWTHRRTLVEAIARSSRPEAAQRLEAYLEDKDREVRQEAVRGLRRLGEHAIEVGLRQLGGGRKAQRLVGVEVLDAYELDDEILSEARAALKKERTADVREALEDMLRKYEELGPDDIRRNHVRKYLRDDSSWSEHRWAQTELEKKGRQALQELGDAAIEYLVSELDAAEIDVRRRALKLLVDQEPDGLHDILREKFSQQSSKVVRRDLALALCKTLPFEEHDDDELDGFLRGLELGLPSGLEAADLPELRWRDGAVLTQEAAGTFLTLLEASQDASVLGEFGSRLDPDVASKALHFLRKHYGADSQEVRIGWVLRAAPVLGNAIDVAQLGRGLNKLAQDGYVDQAMRTIDTLAQDGSPESIVRIEYWSRKARTPVFKSHCNYVLRAVAESKGWTEDELIERTFPQFGFDDDGRRVFEFGARGKLTLRLTATGDVSMTDQTGKLWRRYPGPLQDDDPDTYETLKSALVELRKEIRAAAKLFTRRLEEAMIAQRRWKADDFREILLENPFVFRIARGLVWVLEREGADDVRVRIAEDRTLADVSDELVELVGDARMRVAHPLDFDLDESRRWTQLFSDYEILAPSIQLGRDVFTDDEEWRAEDVDGLVLRRAARRHGFLHDGYESWVCRLERPFAGTTAILDIDPGFHVAAPEGGQSVRLRCSEESPTPIMRSEFGLLWRKLLET